MVAGTAREQAAVHRVRLCEEHLEVLRKDLQDESKNLEEVKTIINGLHMLFPQLSTSTSISSPVNHISRPVVIGDIPVDGYSSGVSYSSTSIESSNRSQSD